MRTTILACAVALLTGCGFNNVNEDEASEGWSVASEPLFKGQQKIQKKAEENPQKLISGETIRQSVDCKTKGKAKFSLSVSLDSDAGMSAEPTVDMKVDYDNCEAREVVVDGDLDIDSPQFSNFAGGGSGGSGNDAPDETVFNYDGKLNFTKDVDGPCRIDMKATISEGSRPVYSGNLCGHDAGDLLNSAF